MRKIKAHGHILKERCRKCGELLAESDEIVSRPRPRKRIRRGSCVYYHKNCWNALFVDVDDDAELENLAKELRVDI